MESNKGSSEFNFKEARLIKKTQLFKDCKNIVIGRGNIKSKILFVGEAPGRNEDEQGLPFVGAAGKNLDKLLASVGLGMNDVYIVNILKCRPPENRNPTSEEIACHAPWLLKQIRDIKPEIVCSLGNYATKFFIAQGCIGDMKKVVGITQLHGEVREIEIEGLKIRLIPLFHPAAIIYNRIKLTPLWKKDMEIVKNECLSSFKWC